MEGPHSNCKIALDPRNDVVFSSSAGARWLVLNEASLCRCQPADLKTFEVLSAKLLQLALQDAPFLRQAIFFQHLPQPKPTTELRIPVQMRAS